MESQPSLYEILGVIPAANDEQIEAAYAARASALMADGVEGMSEERQREFQAVRTAYELLKNPGQRREYDLMLMQQAAAGVQSTVASEEVSVPKAPPKRRGPDLRGAFPRHRVRSFLFLLLLLFLWCVSLVITLVFLAEILWYRQWPIVVPFTLFCFFTALAFQHIHVEVYNLTNKDNTGQTLIWVPSVPLLALFFAMACLVLLQVPYFKAGPGKRFLAEGHRMSQEYMGDLLK